VAQELFGSAADVLDDLAQKEGRHIPATVKWNRRSSPVGMPILLVRAAMTNLCETHRLQHAGDFPRPQYWEARHP